MTRAEKEAAFAATLAAEDVSSPSGIDYRELKTLVVRDWPEMVRAHAEAMKTVRTFERQLAALRVLMVQCSEELGEPVALPPWPSDMLNHKSSLSAFTGEKRHSRKDRD